MGTLVTVGAIAGVAHIRSPAGFLQITPAWVPLPEMVIFVTGLCEIAGAIALAFVPRLRRAAGIALAAYALCVFPANINAAVNHVLLFGQSQTAAWVRLPFQLVFIGWAVFIARGTARERKNASV